MTKTAGIATGGSDVANNVHSPMGNARNASTHTPLSAHSSIPSRQSSTDRNNTTSAAQSDHLAVTKLYEQATEENLSENYEEAIKLYEDAIENYNHTESMVDLAFLNLNGNLGYVNAGKAIDLFTKAASNGNADGIENIRILKEEWGESKFRAEHLHYKGTVSYKRENYGEAFQYYLEASKYGSVDSKYNLALMYIAGEGFNSNIKRAVEFLDEAVKSGMEAAINKRAMMHLDGSDGIGVNVAEAKLLLNKNVEKGNELASQLLKEIESTPNENRELSAQDFYKFAVARIKQEKEQDAVNYLEKAFDKQNSIRMFNGYFHHQHGEGSIVTLDSPENVAIYEAAIKKGNPKAMNNLALMHIFGIGVPEKDLLKARQLLQQAAEAKDPEAMLNLATAYKKGVFGNVDEKEINRLYENAANIYEADINAGKVKAMRNLALMYHFGVGKTVDNNKAVELLEKAVAKGYAPAMQTLGFLHHFNICKKADQKKAEQLYRNAAKLGDLLAMNNLAVLLKQKNGNKYTEEGKALLDEAAEKGHPGAAFTRGDAYKEDGDVKSALAMSELAFRQGNAAAAHFIGNLYEEGKGVEKDEVKAFQLYLLASQWGYNAVSGDLSRLATKLGNQEYDAGHYEKALSLYVTACNHGNKKVANRLGYMLEHGQGHKLDTKEALETAIYYYAIATDEKDEIGSQNYHRLAKQHGYPIKRPLTFWEKFALAVTIVGGAAAFVGGIVIAGATLGTATPVAAFFITVGTSTLSSAGTAAFVYGVGHAWNGQPVDIKALGKEVGYGAAFGLAVGVVAGGFAYVKAVKTLADAAKVAAEGGKIAATEGAKVIAAEAAQVVGTEAAQIAATEAAQIAATEGAQIAVTEAAKEAGKTFGQHALSFARAGGIGAVTYTGARAVERHSEGKLAQHYGSFGKATKTILTDIAIGAAIGLATKGLHVGAKKGAGYVSDKLLGSLSKGSMPERVLGNNVTTNAGKVVSKSMASTLGDCAADGLNALTTGDSKKFGDKWQNLGNAAQIMATAVASKVAGKALGHMASETSDHALTKGDATKNPLGWKGKVAKSAVNGAVEGTTETVVRNIIENRRFEGQTRGVTPAGIAGAAANGGFAAYVNSNGTAPKTENNSQNLANNGKGESMAK